MAKLLPTFYVSLSLMNVAMLQNTDLQTSIISSNAGSANATIGLDEVNATPLDLIDNIVATSAVTFESLNSRIAFDANSISKVISEAPSTSVLQRRFSFTGLPFIAQKFIKDGGRTEVKTENKSSRTSTRHKLSPVNRDLSPISGSRLRAKQEVLENLRRFAARENINNHKHFDLFPRVTRIPIRQVPRTTRGKSTKPEITHRPGITRKPNTTSFTKPDVTEPGTTKKTLVTNHEISTPMRGKPLTKPEVTKPTVGGSRPTKFTDVVTNPTSHRVTTTKTVPKPLNSARLRMDTLPVPHSEKEKHDLTFLELSNKKSQEVKDLFELFKKELGNGRPTGESKTASDEAKTRPGLFYRTKEELLQTIFRYNKLYDRKVLSYCDFESGLCNWKRIDYNTNSKWIVGEQSDEHKKDSLYKGKVMYMEDSTSLASFCSPRYFEPTCLTFNYVLKNPKSAKLVVSVIDHVTETISEVRGYYGRRRPLPRQKWRRAAVSAGYQVPRPLGGYRICLKGYRTDAKVGYIAFNKLNVTSGRCQTENPYSCYDGNYRCKWKSDDPKWEKQIFTKYYDGQELYAIQAPIKVKGTLISPVVKAASGRCLHFTYHCGPKSWFKVWIEITRGLRDILYFENADDLVVKKEVNINLQRDFDYQVYIEGSSSDLPSGAHILNMYITDSTCHSLGLVSVSHVQ